MRGPGVAVVLCVAAIGCGGTSAAGGVTLELGSAHADGSGFVPLGGSETLVAGAQGGFHVWVTYRIRGMAPASIAVHRTTRRVSDDALVLLSDSTIDVGAPGSDGWWQLPAALPNFICPTPVGIDVIGQPLRFDVELRDDKGSPITDASATATVECPSGDEADLCMRICAG